MAQSSRGVPENPELYAQFVADALAAYAEMLETGLGYVQICACAGHFRFKFGWRNFSSPIRPLDTRKISSISLLFR